MIDSGDTAWMLAATALVLLMTPALGLFYAGLVRSRNTLNTFMMCLAALAVVTVAWALVGYSLAFDGSSGIVGGLGHALLAAVGAPSEPLVRALREFKGLPHRVQLVAEARGVRFYDDSKGTNVGATVAALEGFQAPVVLIAGGDDAEARLEREEDELGDGGAVARHESHVVQERVAEPADDAAVAVERQRVAHGGPRHGRDRERGDAHHEGVEGALRAHEPGVEEPERRGHHDHERRGGEHPGGVAAVHPADGGDQRSGAHLRTGVTAP